MSMQTRCWEATRCWVRLQGASPTDHAGRGILLRISVVEDARKSYIPLGIDVGIDLGKVGLLCTPPKYWLHHYANLKDCNIGWE